MGMIRVQMYGSFQQAEYQTSAEEGGHVQAISRSIEFLSGKLGAAVVSDAQLVKEGVNPPKSPLGTNYVPYKPKEK